MTIASHMLTVKPTDKRNVRNIKKATTQLFVSKRYCK